MSELSRGSGMDWPTEIDEYRIVRPLGQSPTGRTFLAFDQLLDRAVVLRFIPPQSPVGAVDERRIAGARALARVQHPSLCRIHRVRDGRLPYVVSDYVRGVKLDSMAKPLAGPLLLEIGRALADVLATLHAAGVTHGDVRPGRVVLGDDGMPCLFGLTHARAFSRQRGNAATRSDVRSLLAIMAELTVEAELGAVLGRWALAPSDPDANLPTAEELRAEIELLARPRADREALLDNPYRGLRPFSTEHKAFFFGRTGDIESLLGRLRSEPWLVVAGRSGAGKSSLVHAGLAPAISGGRLGERSRWEVACAVPGSRPAFSLASAIAQVLSRDPMQLYLAARRHPGLLSRLAHGRKEVGTVLIVDQLEDILTLAEQAERDLFLEILARFGSMTPGLRVIMTLRSDFLARLSELPLLGRELLRATVILPSMSKQGLREAATGPARIHGMEFETKELVDCLVDEAAGREAGLSLLSFVLAELWEARDKGKGLITLAVLQRLGGLAGALARHGDSVYATLPPGQQRQARRILLALVPTSENRVRRSEPELLAEGGSDARSALDALVRGRLVTVGQSEANGATVRAITCYELAHEALVKAWPRLQAWIDEASDAKMAASRLITAALEWDRLGRGREGLYRARQLADLEVPGVLDIVQAEIANPRRSTQSLQTTIPPAPARPLTQSSGGHSGRVVRQSGKIEQDLEQTGGFKPLPANFQVVVDLFLACSRRSVRRARVWRRALFLGVPGLIISLALGVSVFFVLRRQSEISAITREAWAIAEEARQRELSAQELRSRVFQLLDHRVRDKAEDNWDRARTAAEQAASSHLEACRILDRALAIDPRHRGASALYADIVHERLLAAERAHDRFLISTLRPVLDLFDDGARREKLAKPARVSIAATPPSATLKLFRYDTSPTGRLLEAEHRDAGLVSTTIELPVGSYFLVGQLSGHYPTRYPFRVERGEERHLEIDLPAQSVIPEGYVYVPRGVFIYGSREDDAARRFMNAYPERPVETAAFLIKRAEVTVGEYLQFLRALSSDERGRRLLGGIAFAEDGRAFMDIDGHRVVEGEKYCPATQALCIDWLRMPVAGVSWDDAAAFAQWLDGSGRLPNARLCTDLEWERAARGADERTYPHGSTLQPGDACVNSPAKPMLGKIPCEVGVHPASRSPFGVDDMAGNLAEWTADAPTSDQPTNSVVRGGSWSDPPDYLVSTVRAVLPRAMRDPRLSFRVCASF
ncbi:MAG: SUMF1/EgtB/PvdO family nonheme iron enzyme [Pseudomonadota bacterium]